VVVEAGLGVAFLAGEAVALEADFRGAVGTTRSVDPPFDPGEQPLGARAVGRDPERALFAWPGKGHQVLGAGESEDVEVVEIAGHTPLFVRREIAAMSSDQPSPNGPLPAPES
jgi:hypothetical protein